MKDKANAPKRVKKPNIAGRVLALAVTAALVLGTLALVVYRDRLTPGALKRWLSSGSNAAAGEAAPFTHAGGDKLSIACLEDGVATVSAAGAHYYGLDGEHLAEEVLSMENPVLAASATTAVAYDAGNQSLFVFRGKEETFSLSLEGGADLLSARPNDSGWLAVTAQQSGYKGAVTVYNQRGDPVIQISLSSTFAVDAAVSPDGSMVAVVTIGQQNGSFFSRLLLYRVNQKEPFAQIDLGSMTVLDMDFDGEGIWLVGEDRLHIVALTAEGQEIRTCLFSPNYLKGCSLDGDGFAFLLMGRYRSGGADQAMRVDSAGQAAQSIPLTGQVLDYAAAGNTCALLTGSRLSLYNENLEFIAGTENSRAARKVDLSAGGSALLANDQQAWLYVPE